MKNISKIFNFRTSVIALLVAFVGFFIFLNFYTIFHLKGRLIGVLENRFSRWDNECQTDVHGIVVLGGSFDGLAEPGERMLTAIALSKQYPNARIMYSGKVETPTITAQLATQTFERSGIDKSRILEEGMSRDTSENAEFSKIVANPQKSQIWILVTSAFHMPRAVAVFRKAGFNVAPYPVEFGIALRDSSERIALKEFAGLGWYWFTGRSLELFPAPRSERCAPVPPREWRKERR